MPDNGYKVKPEKNQLISDAVALFQSLADNAPALIWMAGPDKLGTYFNRRWLEFRGRTMDQEIGYGWAEGVHPEDYEYCMETYNSSFDSKQDFSMRYRIKRSDGEYRWVLDNGSAFYLPDGEFGGFIGSCLDVTDTMMEKLALEQQNYLFKSISDNATVALFLMDKDNRAIFMNPAAERITGFKLDEIKGLPLHDVLHHTKPDGTTFPQSECFLYQAQEKREQVRDHEEIYIKKSGDFFNALCTSSPIFDSFGHVHGSVLEVRDITRDKMHQRLISQHEDRFKALIEKSSDVITLIDAAGNNLYTSPSVSRVLGYDTEQFQQKNGFDFVHPADLAYVMEEFSKLLEEPGGSTKSEMRVRHADGSWRWIETTSTNMIGDENINAIVVNFRDITERKTAEEKSKYQYYHDSLTDLPNRNFFTEHLAELLESRPEKTVGVIIIDLDRFKMINESLGHAIGDRMIQEVSLRLASCLEDNDVLARLGGDEYGIILSSVAREEEIGHACYKVLECLKPAFRFEWQELYITPSIGISLYPYDGRDFSTLMKNADSALHRAKELGRNNFQYYNSSMNASTFQQLAMENTLRRALENNELEVYYIPQIDLRTGKITQVEALLRWIHPDLGLTFPDEFIPIAETTGLIQPIGEWVLRQASQDVKKWQEAGHDIGLAVNMSARQFRQRHLIRTIRRILAESGFDPAKLELELTESMLVDNSDAVYNAMIQLQRDGVRFTIDDFSTGHSSLDYIKKFPISCIKVAHTFMKNIPMKEKDTAIANAIINLSRSLGTTITAEGVERNDQLHFLRQRECDKAQGYFFSPPVPAEEFFALLQQRHTW